MPKHRWWPRDKISNEGGGKEEKKEVVRDTQEVGTSTSLTELYSASFFSYEEAI